MHIEKAEYVKVQDFKDLIVWQRGKELAVIIYKLTRNYPQAEQYGLTSQLRRAAISIPSNIAEGYARQHTGEFIQFLYTALGSAAELETQLIISEELGYLKLGEFSKAIDVLKENQKMLNGLINSLKTKVRV